MPFNTKISIDNFHAWSSAIAVTKRTGDLQKLHNGTLEDVLGRHTVCSTFLELTSTLHVLLLRFFPVSCTSGFLLYFHLGPEQICSHSAAVCLLSDTGIFAKNENVRQL